jgi:hypothetical protein
MKFQWKIVVVFNITTEKTIWEHIKMPIKMNLVKNT